jgi:hypothetical protein
LYDGNGTQRASMSVDYDTFGGEGLFFSDKDAIQRVTMNVDGEFLGVGSEALIFTNNNGNTETSAQNVGAFFSFEDDSGHFVVNDTNGNQIGSLP